LILKASEQGSKKAKEYLEKYRIWLNIYSLSWIKST
jgi:hypothetical protein